MALYKEIINETGVVSKYHRIADIQQNFINVKPVLTVYMYHYADAKYRDIEKEKIIDNLHFQNITGATQYTLEIDDNKGATRKEIYKRLIKEVEEFEDAKEV